MSYQTIKNDDPGVFIQDKLYGINEEIIEIKRQLREKQSLLEKLELKYDEMCEELEELGGVK